jgi:hypothetical protein
MPLRLSPNKILEKLPFSVAITFGIKAKEKASNPVARNSLGTELVVDNTRLKSLTPCFQSPDGNKVPYLRFTLNL